MNNLIRLEDAIEAIASIDPTDGTISLFTGKQVIGLLKKLDTTKVEIKAETVTEFADRCQECGTHFIPISVLENIKAEIQTLRNCSCSNSDGIIDDVDDILDKYKADQEIEEERDKK